MNEYYKSTSHAITSLQKLACNPNNKHEVTITRESTFGIQISNGKSKSIMNIRRHTKEEMKTRIQRYSNGKGYQRKNEYYTSVAKAIYSIDAIICKHHDRYLTIHQTSKTGILIEDLNNSIEFQIDKLTKKEIRSSLIKFIEEKK